MVVEIQSLKVIMTCWLLVFGLLEAMPDNIWPQFLDCWALFQQFTVSKKLTVYQTHCIGNNVNVFALSALLILYCIIANRVDTLLKIKMNEAKVRITFTGCSDFCHFLDNWFIEGDIISTLFCPMYYRGYLLTWIKQINNNNL